MTDDDGKLEAPVAKQAAETEKRASDTRKSTLIKTGIGLGIGSAAVAAALLYVNHSKNKKHD
jgi:hypothetical protein